MKWVTLIDEVEDLYKDSMKSFEYLMLNSGHSTLAQKTSLIVE